MSQQCKTIKQLEPLSIPSIISTAASCQTASNSHFPAHLWLHCWQAKHSRWYTLLFALITISNAGITLVQAAQYPVVPNNLQITTMNSK